MVSSTLYYFKIYSPNTNATFVGCTGDTPSRNRVHWDYIHYNISFPLRFGGTSNKEGLYSDREWDPVTQQSVLSLSSTVTYTFPSKCYFTLEYLLFLICSTASSTYSRYVSNIFQQISWNSTTIIPRFNLPNENWNVLGSTLPCLLFLGRLTQIPTRYCYGLTEHSRRRETP